MIRQWLVTVAWKRCLQMTKQTCCRAHLCLLFRYADAPRTHALLSALCVVLVSCWWPRVYLSPKSFCRRHCWKQLLQLASNPDHRTVRSLWPGQSAARWTETKITKPKSPLPKIQPQLDPNSISGHKIKARWSTHVGDHFPKINFKINRVDWEKFQITRTQAKNRSRTQNSPDLRSCEDSSDFLRWKCSTHVIEQIKARKTRSNDSQTKKSRTLELGVGEEREEHKSQLK